MSVNSSLCTSAMRSPLLARAFGLVLLFVLASACRREMGVSSAVICDDFSDHSCRLSAPPGGLYKFSLPGEKTESWFDLGYFMYFHARQTPGMRVEFTRAWPEPAAPANHCSFTLRRGEQTVDGHLEGMRWDEDRKGFWCFDYLGSMLIQFHKKFGSVQSKPEMSFFPVHLSMQWQAGSVRAEVTEEIRLEWTPEDSHE